MCVCVCVWVWVWVWVCVGVLVWVLTPMHSTCVCTIMSSLEEPPGSGVYGTGAAIEAE